MLIALVGPPCSGKKTIAEYLCVHHGFQLVRVNNKKNSIANHHLAAQSFDSAASLLDHATGHWRSQFVTYDLTSIQDLEIGFDKRPWFLLVSVEAPISVRWSRAKQLATSSSSTLEDFVKEDERKLYGRSALDKAQDSASSTSISTTTTTGHANGTSNGLQRSGSSTPGVDMTTLHLGIGDLALQKAPVKGVPLNLPQDVLHPLILQAHMRILNLYQSTSELYQYLSTLALPSTHRIRPSWETYFLSLCTLASLRSNCMKRRVGAVLVRNNRVLSTGYNGTPRGLTNCNEGGCPRCNANTRGGAMLDECLCLHAEENALLECGRERGGAEGTVLYCNTCPCLRCAVKIVQTGVREVVYQLDYFVDKRSCEIFRSAGVLFRKYDPSNM
ncbi:unnamed protein product [Sympodiomycopsis kandeliae]